VSGGKFGFKEKLAKEKNLLRQNNIES